MDYVRGAGGAAIGARLRRLSEALDGDAARAYADFGVRFEQRWFGVLNQLALHEAMAVGELAKALRITHVSVSQTCRSLRAARIVKAAPACGDARRKPLMLTKKGQQLVETLTPFWHALDCAASELNKEAGDVATALDRLDDALSRKSLLDRIGTYWDGSQ